MGILGSIRANELTLAVAERLEVKGQVQASNLPGTEARDDFNLPLNCSASKDSRVMLDISAEQLIITASSVIAERNPCARSHCADCGHRIGNLPWLYQGSGPGAPEGRSASDDASVGAGGHASVGASAGFNQTLCAGGDPYGTVRCVLSRFGGGGHNGGSGGGIISIVALPASHCPTMLKARRRRQQHLCWL